MSPQEIKSAIMAALTDAQVEVRDLTGTADHYQAVVASGAFEGKSLIAQHKLVYDALGPKVGAEIHALMLKTCLPSEFEAALAAAS